MVKKETLYVRQSRWQSSPQVWGTIAKYTGTAFCAGFVVSFVIFPAGHAAKPANCPATSQTAQP